MGRWKLHPQQREQVVPAVLGEYGELSTLAILDEKGVPKARLGAVLES
jgi:hypothetical protein